MQAVGSTTCPYCGRTMQRASSRDLLGRDIGPILACAGFRHGCRTFAEIEPRSGRLKGRPADPELRALRQALVEAMKPLWASADRYHTIREQGRWRKPVIQRLRNAARRRAMIFLARELGLRSLRIKWLSKSQCRHAITVCKTNSYRSVLSAIGEDADTLTPRKNTGRPTVLVDT